MKTTTDTLHGAPENFLARFGQHCSGILSGFDRMRFMGSFRTLQDARGMAGYLHRAGVLLKGFADYAVRGSRLRKPLMVHWPALIASSRSASGWCPGGERPLAPPV